MKYSRENVILRGLFHVVSGFLLHFMLYHGNLDFFSNSVGKRSTQNNEKVRCMREGIHYTRQRSTLNNEKVRCMREGTSKVINFIDYQKVRLMRKGTRQMINF